MTDPRPLKVFLCHSSGDKPAVRELYHKLAAEGWIDPWLDEEKLYPGQDWDMEIEKAVEETDAVIVCLSNHSVTKEGYVQHELRLVLNMADYKPEGTLFLFPIRLEDCPLPRRLKMWHCVDFFERRDWAYGRLLHSLKLRADDIRLHAAKLDAAVVLEQPTSKPILEKREKKPENDSAPSFSRPESQIDTDKLNSKATLPDWLTLLKESSDQNSFETVANARFPEWMNRLTWGGIEFVRIPAGEFLMGSQKENKLASADENPQHIVDLPYDYWMARFPVTNAQYADYTKAKGSSHPVSDWQKKQEHPVTYVSWQDAMDYCRWLDRLLKGQLPSGLTLHLPTEAEWEKAVRGPDGLEWPWGNEFDKNKCNSGSGGKGATTPVGLYSPQGDSPFGCADMAGNVWEWCYSLYKPYPYQAKDGREEEAATGRRVLRGGSFLNARRNVRCASRGRLNPDDVSSDGGFRVVVSPILSL